MTNALSRTALTLLALLPVTTSGPALAAQDGGNGRPASSAASAGPTWAEFNKLQAEVKEQRQLLLQIMQNEQQRYDMLLRLIRGGPGEGGSASGADAPDGKSRAAGAALRAAPERRVGTLEGRVKVPGDDTSDIYVYVENFRGPPARGRGIEIRQENKQFVPQVAVVQVGTSVTFPNTDSVFHNVFSNSPRNSFDLGSYRAGDKPRSVVMSSPGVVDVYCNMHQRMNANVLVVPSRLYTKVRPDGSFRLEGVPVGTRTVVAWSPSLKPAKQKLDVTGNGGQLAFTLEYTDDRSHTNKFGQPYGSYKE